MDDKRKVVLVTGGAGFIGSHTCKILKQNGYLPVTYDNLVYGNKEAVQWGPFEQGDILDRQRLHEVFKKYEPAAVIHFAAFAYVGESVLDPGKYYVNNVSGTINLLEVMRAVGCGRIIFSSTCATFGIPTKVPITEEVEQSPVNPYGMSKLMIEQILRDYDHAYGLKHVALRYFNAAGADLDGQAGEDHNPETHLIPLVLEAALGRRDNIVIFGDDYSTLDGTAVRDYIHVVDLADAHVKALQFLDSNGQSDQFNLGSEKGISVKEIIDKVEDICQLKVPYTYGERREGDPPVLVADATKAKQELEWLPIRSNINTVIDSAFKWHRKLSS